jgi:hypothetical protein
VTTTAKDEYEAYRQRHVREAPSWEDLGPDRQAQWNYYALRGEPRLGAGLTVFKNRPEID